MAAQWAEPAEAAEAAEAAAGAGAAAHGLDLSGSASFETAIQSANLPAATREEINGDIQTSE